MFYDASTLCTGTGKKRLGMKKLIAFMGFRELAAFLAFEWSTAGRRMDGRKRDTQ